MSETNLGFLHAGYMFMLDGEKYKAGHADGYGYVYCTNIETHKVKRLSIDLEIKEQ